MGTVRKKLFSNAASNNFYFYVSSDHKSGSLGRIENLRGWESVRIDVFPFNMRSYLQLERLHRSIHKNERLDFDSNYDSLFLLAIPRALFSWLASNSFETIVDQWITFFACWGLLWPDGKEQLAIDQSPPILHESIRKKYAFHRSVMERSLTTRSVDSKPGENKTFWDADCDEIDSIFDKLIDGLPVFLDVRKEGRVDGICDGFNFYGCEFGLNNIDIENRETDKIIRAESSRDSFQFWEHATGRGQFWQQVPGCDVVSEGFIYLLTDGEHFKIGYSRTDPSSRMRSCQTGNARELSLVASIRGSQSVEKSIHRMFAAKRVRGEWFALSESDILDVWKVRHVAT